MADIFEKDIEEKVDLSELEDSTYEEDSTDYVYPENLYRLKMTYSCEGIYATLPSNLNVCPGDKVIVPTRYGSDLALVLGKVQQPVGIKPSDILEVIRKATDADLKHAEELVEKEKEAEKTFKEKVEHHHLDMKFVAVHFLAGEPKALFFFSSENRVDFRELVKDLVQVFKMRIELRQIGVRDECRITGGLGVCGRPFCCHAIHDKLKNATIRMAKDQNLSLNSLKISGQCGRLLCCLAYEYEWYTEARKNLPNEGIRLYYDGTNFKVTEINPISSMVKMLGEDGRVVEINASRFSREGSKWKIN